MIKSMTGYGEGIHQDQRFSVRVEIKSVNSKNRDLKIRIPSALSSFEREISERVKASIHRGTVSVHVSFFDLGAGSSGLTINMARAARIAEFGKWAAETFASQPLTSKDILFYQGVITEQEDGDRSISEPLTEALSAALISFEDNRVREGEILQADLKSHLGVFRSDMSAIVAGMDNFTAQLRETHQERIRSMIEDVKVDESRLATEIGLYAERIDISEEIIRLGAHIDTLDEMVSSGGSIGKKMDFYLQELNREVNTSLAKLRHINAIDTLLNMKETVEKMREQACNVE
ncbi:MAG: YicC family protein [Candidatus Wallbacteria bacterium HGW-Wallbacteria-1]|jgi:uncharacterized protein (TIGR00255 family)|uniref:YicC family protein n=1 Tax=Candidatus Wallbacteria bacterium HGW-Wallbacteria-1 TaxID=2013854 RepID=A0A2N1PUD1_9BACT|nr:MAG: YicC family protein [Candidatus Wallbacteria bacterium HGW-Wallbacteria-1]